MKKLLLILTTIGILLTCTGCDVLNWGKQAVKDTSKAVGDIRSSFDGDSEANGKIAASWEEVQKKMGN